MILIPNVLMAFSMLIDLIPKCLEYDAILLILNIQNVRWLTFHIPINPPPFGMNSVWQVQHQIDCRSTRSSY